jgi:hypothetical protein
MRRAEAGLLRHAHVLPELADRGEHQDPVALPGLADHRHGRVAHSTFQAAERKQIGILRHNLPRFRPVESRRGFEHLSCCRPRASASCYFSFPPPFFFEGEIFRNLGVIGMEPEPALAWRHLAQESRCL